MVTEIFRPQRIDILFPSLLRWWSKAESKTFSLDVFNNCQHYCGRSRAGRIIWARHSVSADSAPARDFLKQEALVLSILRRWEEKQGEEIDASGKSGIRRVWPQNMTNSVERCLVVCGFGRRRKTNGFYLRHVSLSRKQIESISAYFWEVLYLTWSWMFGEVIFSLGMRRKIDMVVFFPFFVEKKWNCNLAQVRLIDGLATDVHCSYWCCLFVCRVGWRREMKSATGMFCCVWSLSGRNTELQSIKIARSAEAASLVGSC